MRLLVVAVAVLAACGGGAGGAGPDAGIDAEPRTFCGDAFPDPGEECDDGNDVDTDGCIACVAATCGDGIVRAVVEECDDASATCLACTTCASGVIDPASGHCYAVIDQTGTRAVAQAACAAAAGHLAAIDTAAEWAAIAPLWPDPYPSRWVGLTRAVDGQNLWRWETGAALDVAAARWTPGEPNDAGAIEDCVEAYGVDGLWNDLACDQVRPALCERPVWTVDPATTRAYRVFHALRTHPEAVADCAAMGAHLTAITTPHEQAFVAARAGVRRRVRALRGVDRRLPGRDRERLVLAERRAVRVHGVGARAAGRLQRRRGLRPPVRRRRMERQCVHRAAAVRVRGRLTSAHASFRAWHRSPRPRISRVTPRRSIPRSSRT